MGRRQADQHVARRYVERAGPWTQFGFVVGTLVDLRITFGQFPDKIGNGIVGFHNAGVAFRKLCMNPGRLFRGSLLPAEPDDKFDALVHALCFLHPDRSPGPSLPTTSRSPSPGSPSTSREHAPQSVASTAVR